MFKNLWSIITGGWEKYKGLLIALLKGKVQTDLRPLIINYAKQNLTPEQLADKICAEVNKLIDRI